MRALLSPTYTKARSKNPLLPEITDQASAEHALKLLPLSLLALRVSKADPHEGHNHAPSKPKNRVKGLWTVKIEQHQDTEPLHHYVWLYEGPQWKQKAMAAGVVAAIFAVVLFPLWPIVLRQGGWYLSVGVMVLLGLFFAMALFRLVLFCVTVFAVPPGLWLFPNLFEDVGVIDSFKPLWGWQEVSICFASSAYLDPVANLMQNKKKKKSKKAAAPGSESKAAATPTATSSATPADSSAGAGAVKRNLAPRVEEVQE